MSKHKRSQRQTMKSRTISRKPQRKPAVRSASRPPPVAAPVPVSSESTQPAGRVWRLIEGEADVGSFTDLRKRRFVPGERLIDDAGRRRLVIAVLDEAGLRLAVSREL